MRQIRFSPVYEHDWKIALKRRDVSEVIRIAAMGMNVNHTFEEWPENKPGKWSGEVPTKTWALLVAANDQSKAGEALLNALLDLRADPNQACFSGETVLHRVIRGGGEASLNMVKRLVQAGADLNARKWSGSMKDVTPLIVAAAKGRIDIMNVLLDAGADACQCARWSESNTAWDALHALFSAATDWTEAKMAVAKRLVREGANPFAQAGGRSLINLTVRWDTSAPPSGPWALLEKWFKDRPEAWVDSTSWRPEMSRLDVGPPLIVALQNGAWRNAHYLLTHHRHHGCTLDALAPDGRTLWEVAGQFEEPDVREQMLSMLAEESRKILRAAVNDLSGDPRQSPTVQGAKPRL